MQELHCRSLPSPVCRALTEALPPSGLQAQPGSVTAQSFLTFPPCCTMSPDVALTAAATVAKSEQCQRQNVECRQQSTSLQGQQEEEAHPPKSDVSTEDEQRRGGERAPDVITGPILSAPYFI